MNKNKQKKTGNIISMIVLVLLVLVVVYLATRPNYGEELSQTEFATKVSAGEITDVYAQSGTARIRVANSKINDKKWPEESDYYVKYTSITDISEIIKDYNDGDGQGNNIPAVLIDYRNYPVSQSLISTLIPYVSILIMVVLAIVFFKMLRGATKGGNGGFGKSKARMEKSNVRFVDIAGADEEKEETKEIVEFLKDPGKFKALGARIPKGVLLVGPPGTGKTLLAKAVAGESEVPFFSISGSDFVELYVGVGASRVRDLFDSAKKSAPCIIFIDEIDAVGRQRGAGLGGGNDEREQTLNQLLVEMDGFTSHSGIVVMAATNRADVLDPALLRPGRFDRQIYVNLPDVKGREGIMRIHAKNKPIDSDVDFTAIARLTASFTGADIENFLNEAAILAARKGKKTISMEEITEGINKVIMGPQKKSRIVTERDKQITAYHESGHAIVAKKFDNGDTVHEVSIIPRGSAGGYTSYRASDDNQYMTYSKLINRICSGQGGRVAEELIFGDITTGASSDIKQCTDIARKMVTELGMSKLGFINFGSSSEVFIGRDYQTQVKYSETTASRIDEEISRIIEECYAKTKKCLVDNKEILENMAKLLLEKETIYTEEVDLILNGTSVPEVIKYIDKKDKAKKRKEDKLRKEQELADAKRMHEAKLQAAIALNKAGILSAEDLEIIKKEVEEISQEPNKKLNTNASQSKESTNKSQSATTNQKTEHNDKKD